MMFLILLVVWFGLCLLMGAGAIFLQGYLNETPPEINEVAWRAPAAGTAVAVFFGIWCWLATGNPDRYAPLTEFSAVQEKPRYPKIKVVVGKETTEYFLRTNAQGRPVYLTARQAGIPNRPDAIIVNEENGEEVKFLPERDAEGKFKVAPNSLLRYVDPSGRVMEEGYYGLVTVVRTGWWFTYILLNLFHAFVWMVAVGVLMQFSFWQSVSITIVAWGVSTLFVMPPILMQARKVYDEKHRIKEKVEMKNRRENLAVLPPVSGVSSASPRGFGSFRGHETRRIRISRYLAATDEGNSILTLTSWPALTATRSVFVSPLNSALIV